MLHNSRSDLRSFWNIVEELRKSVFSKILKLDCNAQSTLLSDEQIKLNIKTLEDTLNMNQSLIMETITKTICSSYGCDTKRFDVPTIYKNVTYETLQSAAEMFTYLNYCPPKLLLSFYNDLFKSASPRNIILAITSINRKAQNSAKESSVTILKKVMETLKLIKYEDIQIITRGYNKSPSLGIYKKKLVTTEDLHSLG